MTSFNSQVNVLTRYNLHELIVLNGVEGKSSLEGYLRLYLSAALDEFYDVPAAAVLHRIKVPVSAVNPLETSYLWLKGDAQLIHDKHPLPNLYC